MSASPTPAAREHVVSTSTEDTSANAHPVQRYEVYLYRLRKSSLNKDNKSSCPQDRQKEEQGMIKESREGR
jgi:hypothetical protein